MVIAVLIYGGIIALVLVIIGQWWADRSFMRAFLMGIEKNTRTVSLEEHYANLDKKKEDYLRTQSFPFEGLVAFGAEMNQQFEQFKNSIASTNPMTSSDATIAQDVIAFPWPTPYNVKVLKTVRFWLFLHDSAETWRAKGNQVTVTTPRQSVKVDQPVAVQFESFFYQLIHRFAANASLQMMGTRNQGSLTIDLVIDSVNEISSSTQNLIQTHSSQDLQISARMSQSAQLEIHVLISNIGE